MPRFQRSLEPEQVLLDRLPTELIVKILENLDYWSLRYSVFRVNKRFRSIILTNRHRAYGHGLFAQVLFRDSPLTEDAKIDKHSILHPIFERLQWKPDSQLHQIGITYNSSGDSRGRFLPLVNVHVRRDNAISPAVTHARIMNEDQAILMEGSGIHSAVTVMDVVKGVDRMFCKMGEWRQEGYWQIWGEYVRHLCPEFELSLQHVRRDGEWEWAVTVRGLP